MTNVIIIVVVLVVIALAVAAFMAGRRRKLDQRRHRAGQLRTKAEAQSGAVDAAQRDAAEAEARAEIARAEAERAEHRAVEAERGVQMEEARQEDALRAADHVDPDSERR